MRLAQYRNHAGASQRETVPVSLTDTCYFEPRPDHPPGNILLQCGPAAAGLYADWTQPGKGSVLPLSAFTYKPGATAKSGGCLINIAMTVTMPAAGALITGLREAYENFHS